MKGSAQNANKLQNKNKELQVLDSQNIKNHIHLLFLYFIYVRTSKSFFCGLIRNFCMRLLMNETSVVQNLLPPHEPAGRLLSRKQQQQPKSSQRQILHLILTAQEWKGKIIQKIVELPLPPFVQVFCPILSAPSPIFLEEKNVLALFPHLQLHLYLNQRKMISTILYSYISLVKIKCKVEQKKQKQQIK